MTDDVTQAGVTRTTTGPAALGRIASPRKPAQWVQAFFPFYFFAFPFRFFFLYFPTKKMYLCPF